MTTHTNIFSDQEDKPLTRSDVEKLLAEVGSSDKLDLTNRNLSYIDLKNFSLIRTDLSGANLTRAKLSGAKLSGANLTRAKLSGANLTRANLTRANLSGADLSEAYLSEADLTRANLSEAYLWGANLSGANLSEADLTRANLSGTNLSGTDLSGTNLSEANLSEADLTRANLSGANLSGANLSKALIYYEDMPIFLKYLRRSSSSLEMSDSQVTTTDTSFDIRVQINEEPLTAQNFASIMSAFTELHTKCWLIAHSRFADLIEYTQTHNERFTKEANLVIVKMTHNSPADIKMNVNADVSAQGLVEALKTGIDAITLAPHRHKAAELENQANELAIKLKELEAQLTQAEREQNLQTAVQNADLDKQKKLLELEQQRIELENKRIELEKRRLELQSERLDLMTKSVNFALEVAGKMVDTLHPGIDAATRAMLVQTLIPNLLQVANGQELKVALPEPKKEETK